MQNRDGHQKGPQDHAEGQHGAKTRNKILEQLHSRNGAAAKQNGNGNGSAAGHQGAHRLVEERKQHDAAEKRSEKTRLSRDIERGHSSPPRIP